ncbi:MAG: sulfate adenylyltransferase subunit CysN, partial [Planctomycetota bacterium]
MGDPAALQKFLDQYANRSLLRFTTVGSVDDGKSTLIGRLLHDTQNLLDDQVNSLREASTMQLGDAPIDFALVTDGLKAEREQGITIDVAYRYFSTARRNFIIADTPGHVQYTRNMATGASTANLAIILIDARHGVVTQTRRHSFIASLLGIPRLLICVNKMDLVDYSEEVFRRIVDDYSAFATKLGVVDLKFIPISALNGDNVVEPSESMPWSEGGSVLHHLETVYVGSDRNLVDFRFPVQWVSRPDPSFRGFAGQIASGRIRPGEDVLVLPSRLRSKVARISTFDGDLEEAFPSQSVTLTLEDEIDISRGDMIVRPNNVPEAADHFEAMVVWMDETPLDSDRRYGIKLGPQTARARVQDLRYRVDVDTLSRESAETLELNEIGRMSLKANRTLFFDSYAQNRQTG